MFWVDETTDEIIKKAQDKYLVTDYKTPSGKIHVGALRGVLIHDVIARALQDKGKTAEFMYGFDDFDPIDDLSSELKKDFEPYLGVPLCNVPAPDNKAKNFAHFFAEEFIDIFNKLGVTAKIVWGSEFYSSGKYDSAIEIVLDHAPEIRQIYKDVSGGAKPDDWFPFQVVCPKCGKLGTTKVTGWDGKEVDFVCEENLVNWAKGCGYRGKISPYGGNGKMPYKVETAAKWFTFKTAVELAGKDHYTKGGTFDIARHIAEKVFKNQPAYGYGYEWFLISGKKMSSSRGVGQSAKEIAEILPAEILRFLMIRTKAKRAIDFDINGETIPLLYDEYDRCAKEFLNDKSSDLGRAYYFSQINPEEGQIEYHLRFSKIAYLIQMPKVDIFEYATTEKGSELDAEEKEEIENRIQIAKKWLELYAPENYKFTILDKLPDAAQELSPEQKTFLHGIAEIIKAQKLSGEELHQQIHQIKKDLNIAPRDAFSAIYLTFLGKDSGPQAGWLLASLDRDFVLKRLMEASK